MNKLLTCAFGFGIILMLASGGFITHRERRYSEPLARHITRSNYGGYDMPKKSAKQRFWSRVDIQGLLACWTIDGAKDKDGYGFFVWQGKRCGAHRVAYEITRGVVPEGLFVLHKCDNPPCVNPNHLFLGTQLDNMRDMDKKNRRIHGEAINTAKLSIEKVKEIRRLASRGVSRSKLACMFGVTQTNIGYVILRKSWKRVL